MGFKTPWFELLILCLCASTLAYSKPLSVELASDDCAESCNTAKEEIVHKIETRDVGEDYTPPEYRGAADTTHEELLNIDSLSDDFDIEEDEGADDESLDESTNSGDGLENIGGAHADNTGIDVDDINLTIDRELPEVIIHDSVNDRGDDAIDDDDYTFGDDDDDTFGDDDTSGAADDTSGDDDDDYADDSFDETRDDDDDDTYDDDRVTNLPDDDDDTFDSDDYESNAEETQDDDDDDTYDDVHVTNLPDDDDDDTVDADDYESNAEESQDDDDDDTDEDAHVTNLPDDDNDTVDANDYESNAEETKDDDNDDTDEDAHVTNLSDDDDDTLDADDYESNNDETQDDDDDTDDDAHVTNLPEDDDDTVDADDYESNNDETQDDDDTYEDVADLDHMTNSPDDDDDINDGVFDLDHVTNTPDDVDDTFGVDDVVDDSFQFPEQKIDDHTNDNKVEGPAHVLEEHPPVMHDHRPGHKSKGTHHHNPLKKHSDSKLGRLLKKRPNTDMKSGKSGKKNLHKDIYVDDEEYNDFESQKRKHKFPRHKGRRTLSLDENSDFDHVENRAISGMEEKENDGNSVERSVDNHDKDFVPSLEDDSLESKEVQSGDEFEQQTSGSVAETTVDDKEAPALIQEDQIEGEEEEEEEERRKIKADVESSVSDNDEGINAASSTPEKVTEEIGQLFEEDKIEGEEEENEAKLDDESVLNSKQEAAIAKEDLLTDNGDQDEMGLGD